MVPGVACVQLQEGWSHTMTNEHECVPLQAAVLSGQGSRAASVGYQPQYEEQDVPQVCCQYKYCTRGRLCLDSAKQIINTCIIRAPASPSANSCSEHCLCHQPGILAVCTLAACGIKLTICLQHLCVAPCMILTVVKEMSVFVGAGRPARCMSSK